MEMTQREHVTKPHIKQDHTGGPMLYCRDGTLHWLSRAEQLWLRLGLTTVKQLDDKYNCTPQRSA